MSVLLNVEDTKKEFPIFSNKIHGNSLIYLDSAATTQKPKRVIDSISRFYSKEYGTVHRAIYELSMESTEKYDAVREKVKQFINAGSEEEIIFTRGTTDSINLVAQSFGRHLMSEGDEILITEGEHHSNIVPWQLLAKEKKLTLKVLPICDDGTISIDTFKNLISSKVKLVAIAHVYNSTGVINPVKEIISIAHQNGAKVLVDGAQAAAHLFIDVKDLDADFYAFSAHKIYGPTGVGVLYGKKEILEKMPPHQGGGDMIEHVGIYESTYQKPPLRFEAGTPMIAQVIGFGEALSFVQGLGIDKIKEKEEYLLEVLTKELKQINGVRILADVSNKVGIVGFVVKDIHPLDIGTFLDLKGIAVRTGHHCAQPTLDRFNLSASMRASFGVYNDLDDVQTFIEAFKEITGLLRAEY